MSAADVFTSATGEPIAVGTFVRVRHGNGLQPARVAEITARGAIGVQFLSSDACTWQPPTRVAGDDVWFTLDRREVLDMDLPRGRL